MATYAGAVDFIMSEMNRFDSSFTIVVQNEVLKAIEFYAPEKFWFNEARVSFTASATIYYPLSSMTAYMLEIDHVSTTVNGGVIELLPTNYNDLQRMDVSNFTGFPTRYAVFNEKIRLYPHPASPTTYQIDVDGTQKLATLSASTDSNAWTTYGLDLIASRVEKILWGRRFKDLSMAQACGIAEDLEYQRLLKRSERLLSVGKLSPND